MKALYKPIPALEFHSISVDKQENKGFEYPWHYHPEYELTYILSSPGVRYVGNSVENFFEDDLVLLGPNLPHAWVNNDDLGQSASAVVIYWKQEFLEKGFLQTKEFEAIHHLLKLSPKGVKFNTALAVELRSSFIELASLPPFEKLMHFVQILYRLATTSQRSFLCEQGFDHDLNYIDHERINIVYHYIKTHYQHKITLADVGEKVNMSGEYFSRFFSKIMKRSFFEFLNEYKINVACRLLIETDLQIAEVCYASGYESLTFFYRQFKKFKNYQPVEYRLNYRKSAVRASDVNEK
ncbi:AraC family transcriptional regulator [Larkinella humicola]|uniref:AraC family transcriptional regulator n=1 Tax=Larkinella humicola TaxID=2607654 RepID=A0A5N1J6X0_9BACT|nr:AraC family transcriptional regulator [Larkinella humicola]KAA9346752.1 AraC family transcriptional regulator [Larkinella humicola]